MKSSLQGLYALDNSLKVGRTISISEPEWQAFVDRSGTNDTPADHTADEVFQVVYGTTKPTKRI